MKEIISFLISIVLLVSITSCNPQTDTEQVSSTVTDEPMDTTLDSSKESFPEDTEPESETELDTESTIDSGIKGTPTIEYELLLDGTAKIVRYIEAENVTEFKVPTHLDGHKVSAIGDEAFKGCKELKKVEIPNGVTSIGVKAFALCSSLESIVLPETCSSLDRGIFYYCQSLTSVTLPSAIEKIPDYMFYMCTSLKSISMPKSVKKIGVFAFNHCSIEQITLHEGITEIGDYAFERNPVKEVTLPSTCLYLGGWAFLDCSNIEIITLNDGLTEIGGGAFYNLSKIKSLSIPDTVTRIGSYSLYGCTSLEELYIPFVGETAWGTSDTNRHFTHLFGNTAGESTHVPQSFKKIIVGDATGDLCPLAFAGIQGITKISIGQLSSIGKQAFKGCTNLQLLTIGPSIKKIDEGAFDSCTSLKEILYLGDREEWMEIQMIATIPSGVSTITKPTFPTEN